MAKKKTFKNYTFQDKILVTILYIFLALFVISIIVPLIYIFIASFMDPNVLNNSGISWWINTYIFISR